MSQLQRHHPTKQMRTAHRIVKPAAVGTTAGIGRQSPSSPQTRPDSPQLASYGSAEHAPFRLLVLSSDPINARTGYRELSFLPEQAEQTSRTHALPATCVGVLRQDQKGFALITNLPTSLEEFKNGDTLNLIGPLCPSISQSADDGVVAMAIRKTAAVPSQLARPKFQYLVFGDVLSAPTAAVVTGSSVQVFQSCEFCPEMVSIAGGTFAMGGGGDPTERPVHQVTVSPLAMGRAPVTVSQWRQCVLAMVCSAEPIRDRGYNDTPVHNLSWDDAQQYVKWLSQITNKNYRLPSEAEWEYAARAGSRGDYWWGDRIIDGMANCRDCGEPYKSDMPIRATSFMPNPFGLYGMAGGIAQWVADCWHDSYVAAPADGSPWEEATCSHHVLRGGSWRDELRHMRAASRDHDIGQQRDPSHGFRVVCRPKVRSAAARADREGRLWLSSVEQVYRTFDFQLLEPPKPRCPDQASVRCGPRQVPSPGPPRARDCVIQWKMLKP